MCLCVGVYLIGMGIGEIGVNGENRAIDAYSSELREAGLNEFHSGLLTTYFVVHPPLFSHQY